MRRWKLHIVSLLLLLTQNLHAQPEGYYTEAYGLTGDQLKSALHNIINDHTVSSYSDLWSHFQKTDKKDDGSVWDIYSTTVWTFTTDQCGNYNSEGDCYNREHSFPKSWFGGEVNPMFTDLFHIYPTDGWVNNKRGNLPYGETSSPSYTSSNGSSVGTSVTDGYNGEVFEPADEFKGDLARTFFYMAVRYHGEDSNWPGSGMTIGADLAEWALNMLLRWHSQDPVTTKEKNRNDSVYTIQGNRNPFIDDPGYATAIWDGSSGKQEALIPELFLWPNPATDIIHYSLPQHIPGSVSIKIISLTGKQYINIKKEESKTGSINISSFPSGVYLVICEGEKFISRTKIIVL